MAVTFDVVVVAIVVLIAVVYVEFGNYNKCASSMNGLNTCFCFASFVLTAVKTSDVASTFQVVIVDDCEENDADDEVVLFLNLFSNLTSCCKFCCYSYF